MTAAPIRAALVSAALVWPVVALGQGAPEATARYGPIEAETLLRVQGTTDVPFFEPVLRAFVAARPGLGLVYEQWASNDLAAAARAACDGASPAADVLVSSAVDQLAKYVNDGCARPHRSAATAALPADRNWRDELFGVTREPAVIVYNRDLVPAEEAPATRFDLLDLLRPEGGRYAGRVATYDIEASGLGYLFAFADSQQATTFGGLIEAFGRSGATATCCSDEIIDGVAEGRWLIAYNVLGSYALARAARDPRIVVVAPADYTLVLSRGAVIPRDAPDPETAGEFVDFLLSEPGRRALAEAYLLDARAEGAEASGQSDSTFRPIALSPTLLLGLDAAKRAGFLAFWRAAFPPPP